MKEKRFRNKARDIIGDYYLTNRKVSKENEEACKNVDMTKFSKTEKIYVAIIIVGLILIVLRHLLFS